MDFAGGYFQADGSTGRASQSLRAGQNKVKNRAAVRIGRSLFLWRHRRAGRALTGKG